MAWVYLVLAGLFEVVWALGLKLSDGFSKPIETIWTIAAMAISFFLLSLALKELPLGTAYAIWTGIGTLGSLILGIMVFGDPATAVRMLCAGLILAGIIGLKLSA